MPEHVHLLVSEPEAEFAVDRHPGAEDRGGAACTPGQAGWQPPFWQKRYYDHNVRGHRSFVEKLRYIHRNPVKRGLCARP
jgi:putative transposase